MGLQAQVGVSSTGASSWCATSLGRPSEMPTVSRTEGALTASCSRSGRLSPSGKIWSATSSAARPASVSARPRQPGLEQGHADRLLQLPHLGRDRLHRQTQTLSAPAEAPSATTQK